MTALPTTANRARNRRPVDAKVPASDMEVFDEHVKLKQTTPENLLTEIVRQWANHPGRSESTVLLPVENCVLYQDESLTEYTSRVALAVITSVRLANKGNLSATAGRLRWERTALYRLLRRLKAGTNQISQLTGPNQLSDRLASLESVKREHIFRVLESVKGQQHRAARILGIPDSELATILLGYSKAEVTNIRVSDLPKEEELHLPAGAMQLPPETAILYEDETIEDYTSRVMVALFQTVKHSEGSMAKAAKRLECHFSRFNYFLNKIKKRNQTKAVDTAPQ